MNYSNRLWGLAYCFRRLPGAELAESFSNGLAPSRLYICLKSQRTIWASCGSYYGIPGYARGFGWASARGLISLRFGQDLAWRAPARIIWMA